MGILKTKIFLALAFFPSDQAENKAFYTLSKPTQGGGVGKVFTLTNQQTSAVFLSPPCQGIMKLSIFYIFPHLALQKNIILSTSGKIESWVGFLIKLKKARER